MARIKVTTKFNDLTANGRRRNVGDILTVDEARAKYLISQGFAEEAKEEANEAAPETEQAEEQ